MKLLCASSIWKKFKVTISEDRAIFKYLIYVLSQKHETVAPEGVPGNYVTDQHDTSHDLVFNNQQLCKTSALCILL